MGTDLIHRRNGTLHAFKWAYQPRVANDPIPHRRAELLLFLQNLSAVVNADLESYFVPAPVGAVLAAKVARFAATMSNLTALETAIQVGLDQNNVAAEMAEEAARRVIRAIESHPQVSDHRKAAAGLTPHEAVLAPSQAPATVGIIDVSSPSPGDLKFMIHDSAAADGYSIVRPKGYAGFELWEQVGDTPPKTHVGMTWMGLQTKTCFTIHQDPLDTGKTFFFIGRWVSTTCEVGQWSDVASCVLS